MEDRLLLYIAVIVFALAIIGLVLTVLEFRYGAPRQQDEEAKARQHGAPRQQDEEAKARQPKSKAEP